MKNSTRCILTLVLLFTFSSGLFSCGKKDTVEKTSEKKEQTKTVSKTTEKKDSTKSISTIVIFDADNGTDPKQITRLGDGKDYQVNSNKDFVGDFRRSETGYEKGTEKFLENITGVPDLISFTMKNSKPVVSLIYDSMQDNESSVTVSKFENEGNNFTLTFAKDGSESVITGILLYIDMKVKGWKENQMKVLLIESGKNKVIYFVGPDWAG